MGDAIICGYMLTEENFNRLIKETPAMQKILTRGSSTIVIVYDRWRSELPRHIQNKAPHLRCTFIHTPHRVLYSSSGSQAKLIPTTVPYHHSTSSLVDTCPTGARSSSQVSKLGPTVSSRRPSRTRPGCMPGSVSSTMTVTGRCSRKKTSSSTGR